METFFSETVSTGGGDANGFEVVVAAYGAVDFDLDLYLDNNVFFYDVLNYYVLNYYYVLYYDVLDNNVFFYDVLNDLFLGIVFFFFDLFWYENSDTFHLLS